MNMRTQIFNTTQGIAIGAIGGALAWALAVGSVFIILKAAY